MFKEIRRVPLDWGHPTRETTKIGKYGNNLLADGLEFIPLLGRNYYDDLREWENLKDDYQNRDSIIWKMSARKHLIDRELFFVDRVHEYVYDETHLDALLMREYYGAKPKQEEYMPPVVGEAGWCLYETLTYGTPITPIYYTVTGIIEYLCNHGDAYDGTPYKQKTAEKLILKGLKTL